MANISTEILHYKGGTSDKIYIIEVNNIGRTYITTTSYGPTDAQVLTSRIIYNGDNKWEAERNANKVSKAKKSKGYKTAAKNLRIAGYNPNSISIDQIVVDTKKTTSTTVITGTIPTARRIKV